MVFSFKALTLFVSSLFLSLSAFAAIEMHEFSNELERKRYQSFIEEMRCPKCQNQNLAGSDSAISIDLRNKLYEMIKLEKSDKEITDFMVERYGDYPEIEYFTTFAVCDAVTGEVTYTEPKVSPKANAA